MKQFSTILSALMTALLLAGCEQSTSKPSQPSAKEPPGVVKRGMDRQTIQGHLTELGLIFQMYHTDAGRSPSKLEDLQPYIQRDNPKLYQALQEGHYVVNYNAPLGASTVMAYEKEPYKGTRIVLMGDRSVSIKSEQELQAALKAGR